MAVLSQAKSETNMAGFKWFVEAEAGPPYCDEEFLAVILKV